MKTLKRRMEKINWSEVYMAAEYIAALYVVISFLLNFLQIAGLITSATGVLQPTFYGASQIVVLLLQYGLQGANKRNHILERIRPYVAGIAVAGIVSTCNLSLGLLLLLLVGYFLWTGYPKKFRVKDAVFAALIASIGIEICSVAMLLTGGEWNTAAMGFMGSVWTDVLFVVVAIVYCLLNREASAEVSEGKKNQKLGKAVTESLAENKYWMKLMDCLAWAKENSKPVVRYFGGSLCIFSLGLFFFYFVSTSAGANKIVNSGEEVYLLQHCEDTSLVLTLVEDKKNETYTVEFREYTGANNQKVRFEDCGDGLYRLVFVEPQRALEVVVNEKTLEKTLAVNTVAGTFKQYWVKEGYMPEQSMYRLLCAYSDPLSYQMLSQTSGKPQVMVRAESGGYEFFTLSRTVDDEFATEMVWRYGEKFTPSLLTETMLGYLGGWAVMPFLLVAVLFCVIIYARRVVGDKPAVLYAVVFAYMLTYSSIGAIVLYLLAIGLLHVNAYMSKQAKHKQKALVQFTGNLTTTAKDEMQESLDKMEAALQEMREKLFAEINVMAGAVVSEVSYESESEAESIDGKSEQLNVDVAELSAESDEDELDELMGRLDLAETEKISEADDAVDESEGIDFEALADEGDVTECDALDGDSADADVGDELNQGEEFAQSNEAELGEKVEKPPVKTQRSTANGKRKRNRKRR